MGYVLKAVLSSAQHPEYGQIMDGKPLPCSCTERNSADHSACDL